MKRTVAIEGGRPVALLNPQSISWTSKSAKLGGSGGGGVLAPDTPCLCVHATSIVAEGLLQAKVGIIFLPSPALPLTEGPVT